MVNFTLNPNETKRPIGAVDPDVDPLIHPELYIGLIFKRVAAYIIDALIISVIVGFVWVGLGILGIVTLGLTFGLMGIVIFIIPFAYHTFFIGGPNSATIGMQIMDIEVRRWIGGSPDYSQAAVLTVLFYGSIALTAWLILLIAFFGNSRRCLHDYFSGTVVVNKLDALVSAKRIAELAVDQKSNEA
ncbi:MAG: RDD family protein [Rhodospirillaceae bacterium]|nr:RDD family protein [Rhodospirillaceae bacterium]MBT4587915.1 RDD family protein [Rhodospirillaceae bacterium]MBT5940743.1 RDD family protein [Rhodospirillaceae bacterium]MBT7266518.1 RDD family protein [Rhodospirillaceae bacterium]